MKNGKMIAGLIIGIATIALTIFWFDFKLAAVIFLAIFANNLERSGREK